MKNIDTILAKYEYDTSIKAYEESPMVQMLKNRDTEILSFLDKYEQN